MEKTTHVRFAVTGLRTQIPGPIGWIMRKATTTKRAPVSPLTSSRAIAVEWRRSGIVSDPCHAIVAAKQRYRDSAELCSGDPVDVAHLEAHGANRVAELALNAPLILQILQEVGARAVAVLAKFLCSRCAESLITGDYIGASVSFLDYWGVWIRVAFRSRTEPADAADVQSID